MMARAAQPIPDATPYRWGGVTLLFFAVFWGFVWGVIDPALQYHALSPVFFRGIRFWRESVNYPGDLLAYGSRFVMQFYQWNWLGALISTALAALTCGATLLLLRRIGVARVRIIHLLPAAGLLCLQSRFAFPIVETSIGLLVVAGFLLAYIYAPWQCPWLRFATYAALSVVLYLAVAGEYLIFALCCALYEGIVRRRCLLGVASLFGSLILPYGASHLFMLPWSRIYFFKLPWGGPFHSLAVPLGLCLFFPLVILGSALASRFASEPVSGHPKKPSAPPSRRWQGHWKQKAERWISHPLMGLFLAVVPAGLSFEAEAKRLVRIDYLSHCQNWPSVLEEARHLRSFSAATIVDIDWAACQTSQLLYTMFAYPHKSDTESWLDLHGLRHFRMCLKISDVLFELGQVNKSEWLAAESLEINGPVPAVLERLALINILKGEPAAARVFLNLLDQALFHRGTARRLLEELAADPTLSGNEELNRIRPFMLQQDYTGQFTPDVLMLQLLQRNPRNRMAFEFLMAHYLLTLELDKIQEHLYRLGNFHYPDVPRHLEEALLIRQMLKGGSLQETAGGRINPHTLQRFKDFHERFMSYKGDLKKAQAGLREEYGDTYWFYYMFGASAAALQWKDVEGRL